MRYPGWLFSLIFALFFLFPSACFCYPSEALEKVTLHQLYPYQIEEYAKSRFKFDLSKLRYSDDRIDREAALAGWDAFKTNCDIQGSIFTIGEECLSMGFLKGINGIQGEIGGGFVVLQLFIDLSQKEYKQAVFNVTEGGIQYAIGKWGTRAMKISAVAYTATKLYLTTIATTLKEQHDEFFYRALKNYFNHGAGRRDAKQWIAAFNAANGGNGVKTQEDVVRVVDEYINQVWNPDEFYFALGDVKDDAGKLWERDATPMFEKDKQHFIDYIKSVIIFPYLEPVLNGMIEQNIEKESKKIIESMNAMTRELNRVYTMKGAVKGGLNDKVSGLTVKIPGFLETTTDLLGRYQFRFTLYSLLKSRQPLVVELSVPTKDGGTRYLTRSGRITDKHRKTGIINVKAFNLSESSAVVPAIDMDAQTFYGLYCKTALKLQPAMYSSMDRQTYEKMCASGQGVFRNESQCVAYYTKLEAQAEATWKNQGESPERIKQGIQAFRKLYKMMLTRDGCKKFYGGFVGGLYGLSKSAGNTDAEREANFQRARNEMIQKAEKACSQLPEKLDW